MKIHRLDIRRTLCLVLLALTFFSSYILARYASSFNGSGNASVAKWSVDFNPSSSTLNLVAGNTAGAYTLTVTSNSEVSATYSINLSNVPSGMEVKIDSGSYQTVGSSGAITFSNVGSFASSDVNNSHNHTITFNAPLASNIPSVNTVDIDVVFVQND